MVIRNSMIGIKIAKQPSKGAPKDGGFRDVRPVKNNPQCPYTNPAKAVAKGMATKVGKLGK